MGIVVGAPGGHKADGAGQTPRADAQTTEAVEQSEQTPQQRPGAAPVAGPSSDQKPQQTPGGGVGEPTPEQKAQQTPGTPPVAGPTSDQKPTVNQEIGQRAPQADPLQEPPAEQIPSTPEAPGFGERGRMRRRARFLRKARELAYRDLGGLVFDLHRFGQRNDQLVLAKLATLRQIDGEVRKLEEVLRDRRPVTVLREVGIAACPRCAAIHGSDDRFCPGCGLAFDMNADRPISTASVTAQAQTSLPGQQATATSPASTTPPATPTSPATSTSPATVTPPASLPSTASFTPASTTPPANPATPASPTPPASVAQTPGVAPAPSTFRAPPLKSTAQPVAAKPASPLPASEPKASERAQEDEPTQILRPPSGDADA